MNRNATVLVVVIAVIVAAGGVAYGLSQKHDKQQAEMKAESSSMMLKDAQKKLKSDDAMMKSDKTSSDAMTKSDTSTGDAMTH